MIPRAEMRFYIVLLVALIGTTVYMYLGAQ